jgi:hypothetical protein
MGIFLEPPSKNILTGPTLNHPSLGAWARGGFEADIISLTKGLETAPLVRSFRMAIFLEPLSKNIFTNSTLNHPSRGA